ncbi:MAG: hypothetical protein ACXWUG_00215 [Polyangiales bacterium]
MNKCISIVCAVLLSAGTAGAAEMGDKGTMVVSGTGAVSGMAGPEGYGTSGTFAYFTPRLAWFMSDGVSISVGPRYVYCRQRSENGNDWAKLRTSSYGAEVRVGSLIHVADRVSLWPQIGVFADFVDTQSDNVQTVYAADGSTSQIGSSSGGEGRRVGVNAEVPILLALTQHTFVSFSFVLAGYEKQTQLGMVSRSAGIIVNPQAGVGFGGWF